ncbi:hypothetical protein [uncultured Alistipes sp.]|jgi:hypothetical protein|uniref:hypothetical protein n=1 Tax=uncultured Alistipes sp. TaxID=538949 RepID=UPI0025D4E172|nr:hypothetical protein [uncultured Alistipes sp.]
MKKLALLVIFILSIGVYCQAQTVYYQAYERVNSNGVKSPASGGKWIAFQNNMNICYESNENGYAKNSMIPPYKFIRTHKGTHIYECRTPSIYSPYGNNYGNQLMGTYYFSNDFSQMQDKTTYGTIHYRRTAGPAEYNDDVPIF